MKPIQPFARGVWNFIHQEQLIAPKDSILVAVSGGPDSVALLHVLVSLQEPCGISRITVLHFDHQLRAEASAADRVFVRTLAENLGLAFHEASEDVGAHARRHHLSVEMAARACRHRFFKDALNRFEAQALALGHTANDQAEEIQLRLLRGTGPSGMAGMRPRTSGGIIRPLLFASRAAISAYLEDQQLSFREDVSNRDPAHQRNALRHEVFPLFERHFHPGVVEVLCRYARLVTDEESFWQELLATHWATICTSEAPSRMVISRRELLALHPALQRRLLRHAIERLRANLQGVYAAPIEAILKLLAGVKPGRSITLPGGLRAAVEGEFLIVSREPREASPIVEQYSSRAMSGPGRYRFPSFGLALSLTELPAAPTVGPFPDAPKTMRLDAESVKWPLYLRFWKDGDRFCPLGLGGSKKLQDFFVDSKVPGRERRRVPLLCDQEKICWVVGYRLNDRVKVTPQTKRILVIEKSDLV
jgi:tRNA(Ile)-lysidine synthase